MDSGPSPVAYHEAGHCVAGHVLGATINSATVLPAKAGGRPGATDPDFGGLSAAIKARRQVVFLVAGQTATDGLIGIEHMRYRNMGDLIYRHQGPHAVVGGVSEGGGDFHDARLAASAGLAARQGWHWATELGLARRVAERIMSLASMLGGRRSSCSGIASRGLHRCKALS